MALQIRKEILQACGLNPIPSVLPRAQLLLYSGNEALKVGRLVEDERRDGKTDGEDLDRSAWLETSSSEQPTVARRIYMSSMATLRTTATLMAWRARKTTTNTTKVTHVTIVTTLLRSSVVLDAARRDKAYAGIHMVVRRERMKAPTHQTSTQRKDGKQKGKGKERDEKQSGVSRQYWLQLKCRHIGSTSQANARPS